MKKSKLGKVIIENKIEPVIGEVWLHETSGFVEIQAVFNSHEFVCQMATGRRRILQKCFLMVRVESIDVEKMTCTTTDRKGVVKELKLKK